MLDRYNLKRDYSVDLVRIFAVILVISNHFFLHSGFYYETVVGKRMYALNVIRTFSLSCVPLFIILTGYLMCEKTLCKKYYCGIRKTICIYVLASIANIVYIRINSPQDYDVKSAVLDILGFKAASYSWYIEMYIGLFLLIPFLNLIYKNLSGKKQKQCLIITLLLLTAVPNVVNIYNFFLEDWWKTSYSSTIYQKIFPAWWMPIYPFTYYFIGCYLKENEIKIKRGWNVIFLICSVLFYSTFCFYRYYNSTIVETAGDYQEWGALFNVIQAVLLFIAIEGIKEVNKLPLPAKKVIKYLSDLTLGAYLVSSVFDAIFYPKLNEAVKEIPHKLEYFIIIVLVVSVCSFLASVMIHLCYRALEVTGTKMKSVITDKRS